MIGGGDVACCIQSHAELQCRGLIGILKCSMFAM